MNGGAVCDVFFPEYLSAASQRLHPADLYVDGGPRGSAAPNRPLTVPPFKRMIMGFDPNSHWTSSVRVGGAGASMLRSAVNRGGPHDPPERTSDPVRSRRDENRPSLCHGRKAEESAANPTSILRSPSADRIPWSEGCGITSGASLHCVFAVSFPRE